MYIKVFLTTFDSFSAVCGPFELCFGHLKGNWVYFPKKYKFWHFWPLLAILEPENSHFGRLYNIYKRSENHVFAVSLAVGGRYGSCFVVLTWNGVLPNYPEAGTPHMEIQAPKS